MAIVPSGSPAWARTADHSHYGGHVAKKNYQSQGVTNPRTDVGAEAIVRQAADTAAAVRTAKFASITFLNNDGTPDAPTIESVEMMTGVLEADYEGDAPPTGFPGATRSGTGHVVFTFASTYTDEYGVVAAFAPRRAHATGHGATFVNCTATVSGQTVIVRCFDAAGTALADKRVTLTVW
jgi:hypothetical protein